MPANPNNNGSFRSFRAKQHTPANVLLVNMYDRVEGGRWKPIVSEIELLYSSNLFSCALFILTEVNSASASRGYIEFVRTNNLALSLIFLASTNPFLHYRGRKLDVLSMISLILNVIRKLCVPAVWLNYHKKMIFQKIQPNIFAKTPDVIWVARYQQLKTTRDTFFLVEVGGENKKKSGPKCRYRSQAMNRSFDPFFPLGFKYVGKGQDKRDASKSQGRGEVWAQFFKMNMTGTTGQGEGDFTCDGDGDRIQETRWTEQTHTRLEPSFLIYSIEMDVSGLSHNACQSPLFLPLLVCAHWNLLSKPNCLLQEHSPPLKVSPSLPLSLRLSRSEK